MWLAIGLVLPADALPVYSVELVGPAGVVALGMGLNASGEVAGTYALADGSLRGFVWRGAESVRLEAGPGQSVAVAIDDAGNAGGYAMSGGGAQSMAWSGAGAASPGAPGYVLARNGAGDTAGMRMSDSGEGYAFWTHGGVVHQLNSKDAIWGAAYALGSDGEAAGTLMNSRGVSRAFAAGGDGEVLWLGPANSHARAVAAGGWVAGHAARTATGMEAVVWVDGVLRRLGTLGGGNSYGLGVNEHGLVIGSADLADGTTAAFLHDGMAMWNLNTLIAPDSGWRLLGAFAINASGQIAGYGIYNGEQRAFLLTPDAAVPEPATVVSTGILLALLALLRSR